MSCKQEGLEIFGRHLEKRATTPFISLGNAVDYQYYRVPLLFKGLIFRMVINLP